MHKLATILLAAGQGTRMKSSTPKMLHRLAGRPLIYYSVRAALDAGSSDVIVVVGHGAEAVQRYLTDTFGSSVRTVLQSEQRGTGHAALDGDARAPRRRERADSLRRHAAHRTQRSPGVVGGAE